jgi:hypothetical protein
VSSVGSAPTSYKEDKWGNPSWQFSRAVQGRLRRDGTMIELTVDKGSVAGYSPDSNDVNTEAVIITVLKSVVRIRLVKTEKT